MEKDIYNLHIKWCGDLSDKKVLDLGCYEGNSLSIYLAQESKSYLGIDLSEKGINVLNNRLKKVSNARAEVIDFLSKDFHESEFDLIYAYGVLHHFRNVDELIQKLQDKLKSGGMVISHDPLQTNLLVRLIRAIYRPFQSDKEWEWPFTRKTFYKFEKAFEIKDRRAVLGKSKWAVFLNLSPLSEKKRKDLALKWHRKDWEKSQKNMKYIFNCMQLSMLLKKI